jgi:hypothetical protein
MSALDGLKAAFPAGISLPGLLSPEPASASASSALRFDGWAARPGLATISGDARFSGNPAEHRAIAQTIVDLILEPTR